MTSTANSRIDLRLEPDADAAKLDDTALSLRDELFDPEPVTELRRSTRLARRPGA
jgi:hypothetical protein